MIVDRKFAVLEDSKGDFEGVDASLSLTDMDLIFSIVSENFYSDIFGSIVRELASNCVDSHTEAGVDDPVLIKGYNYEGTDFISFIDVGVGLSPERFKSVYMKYFSSTKRESNDYVGYFGIGSKSPLGYVDSFEVITRSEGTEYHWIVGKSETGKPRADLFNTKETTERNGTEVKITIEKGDYDKFKKAVHEQLLYFDNIYVEGFNVNNGFNIIEGNTFKCRGNLNNLETFSVKTLHIAFGRVVYPINWEQIGREKIELPLGIKFNLGELNVTNNREQIVYTDESKALINERIDLVLEELRDLYNNKVPEFGNLEEFMLNRNKKVKTLLLGPFEIELPTLYKYNHEKGTFNYIDVIKNLNTTNYGEFKGLPLQIPENPFFIFNKVASLQNGFRKKENPTELDWKLVYGDKKIKVELYRISGKRESLKDRFIKREADNLYKYPVLVEKRKILKTQIKSIFDFLGLSGTTEEKNQIHKQRKNYVNRVKPYLPEEKRQKEDFIFKGHPIKGIPNITNDWNKTKLFKFYKKVITKELVDKSKSYNLVEFSEDFKKIIEAEKRQRRAAKVEGIISVYDLNTSTEVKVDLDSLFKFKGIVLYSKRGDSKRLRPLMSYFQDVVGYEHIKGIMVGTTVMKNFIFRENFYSVDELMNTNNKHLVKIATIIVLSKKIKDLASSYGSLLNNLDKISPSIDKKYTEVLRYSQQNSYAIRNLTSADELFMDEVIEKCIENKWIFQHYLDDLQEVENYLKDLELFKFISSEAFNDETGIAKIVEYLKFKRKRLDPIFYFIPNESERTYILEASRQKEYVSLLNKMRASVRYPHTNLLHRTPYF